ncbi:glycosyl hydrolase family 95 catalytic domain-containing protein [Flammeovirga aprica]|uniref:Uncharacterized protein n=1 Tax=Flammeovirga aprica JL-4 TaxID=694437 RepID=A0A7X9P396_9BACT|nr:hypothetical protein [Flammeovirga aprica]NME68212.1 hypothetical protein [Flammeovirga aprica JL-4]
MAQHDLTWEEIPSQWAEGAFVGNGQLGMMMYAKLDENRFNFHIGRQDVTDHRKAPNKKTSMGVDGTNLLDFSRLDIGKMVIRPEGKILNASLRQDLWNAEVRGTIYTDLGQIDFRAFTAYDDMLQIIELTSSEQKEGKECPINYEWLPGDPSCPRAHLMYERYKDDYLFNPHLPEQKVIDGVNVCVQKLEAGGDYATAWKAEKKGAKTTLYLTTANEVPASNVSEKVAVKEVQKGVELGVKKLEKATRKWWHSFYQKSFLSMPDNRMESFYWIQLYKLATCSRVDGPALDLNGVYFKNTSWPGLWWNLNVQLTYWPFNTSNHQDIAYNYIELIDEQFEWIMRNRTGKSLGDYGWALHNYWLYFDYQGDDEALYEKWLPKAKRIIKKYEDKLIQNDEGKYELTPMGSPEYKGFKSFQNTNYNLAVLRWLLNESIALSQHFNANTELITHWKGILNDLIDYPTDENGLMIGSDQPVDMSHRHYSHLLALYPLFQLDPDSEKDRDLVVKSVLHWHNIENGKALAGYSFTGASSLYSALGMGNEAEAIMQTFLDAEIGGAHFLPNTFYMEGSNPVIETPLSGASSIMEYSLQSWGGKVRIFPAIPEKWEEASFSKLLAQGGFEVSASLQEKEIKWVEVKSLAGKVCILKIPGWENAYQISKGKQFKIEKMKEGEFCISLQKGEKVTLGITSKIKPILKSIPHPEGKANYFGVKKHTKRKPLLEAPILEYKALK